MYFRSLPDRHQVLEIYLAQVLYGVGLAMIGIFIPLYLIELGFTLQQALIYVLVDRVAAMVFAPIAAALATKYGLKKTTLIRIPFLLLTFLGLFSLSLPSQPLYYLIPAIANGIRSALYWIPIHSLFTRYSHKKSLGSEVGILESVPAAFRILAPAVGGIIAATLGFPVLIIVALCLIASSTLPLFVSKDTKANSVFRFKNLFKVDHFGFFVRTAGYGFASVAGGILFPIHVFLVLRNPEQLGFIFTLGGLIFAVGSYLVGKRLLKKDRKPVLMFGALLFAFTLWPRPFLSTIPEFAMIIVLGAFTWSMYHTSYTTVLYQLATDLKGNSDEFHVMREMVLNFSRVVCLLLCIIFPWQIGFFLAAIGMILGEIIGRKL